MKSASRYKFYGKVDTSKWEATDFSHNPELKRKILEYMNNPDYESACTTARVFDYFKNEEVDIPMVAYENDSYYWDDRDIYYLDKYNIAPCKEFINYITE